MAWPNTPKQSIDPARPDVKTVADAPTTGWLSERESIEVDLL